MEAGERVGVILGNFDFGSVPNVNWEIHNDGQVRIFWNNGKLNLFGTTDLRDDTWRHLAFVRDTTAGEFRVYIDGVEETLTLHASAGSGIAFTTPHRIGNDNRAGTGIPFHDLGFLKAQFGGPAPNGAYFVADHVSGSALAQWHLLCRIWWRFPVFSFTSCFMNLVDLGRRGCTRLG